MKQSRKRGNRMFKQLSVLIWMVIGFVIASFPASVSAHATLTSATPAPNSNLKQAPEGIMLEFNERLEDSQYFIKLYDAKGKQVETENAQLSDDHQLVTLQLPDLRN